MSSSARRSETLLIFARMQKPVGVFARSWADEDICPYAVQSLQQNAHDRS